MCKKGRSISDITICNKIFPNINYIIDSGLPGHLKDCSKNIPTEVADHVLNTDSLTFQKECLSVADDIITSVLDANKIKLVILALRNIIKYDKQLHNGTIIGFQEKYKKEILVLQNVFVASEFLANILFYTISNGNNKNGRTGIYELNGDFFKSLIEMQSSITLVYPGDEASSIIKQQNQKINKLHPFQYNSCTTKLVGRDKEWEQLEKFILPDKNCNIKWFAIIGPGGSGKSRLAFEFACGLDVEKWSFSIFSRDLPLTIEQLQRISDCSDKNLFLIIDKEASDMEPLARWMSHEYAVKSNRQYRILICQRMPAYENSSKFSNWYGSIVEYNECIQDLLYESESGGLMTVNVLNDTALADIARSYISTMYENVIISTAKISLVVERLHTIDSELCRPLYLIFLADAMANGNIEDIHNEDNLLNYAFLRERNYLRNKIQEAFGCDYKHNSMLYDSIELSYAHAIIETLPTRAYKITDASEYCNLSTEKYIALCDNFGITVNGNIIPLEPDLLAEYYVMRYGHKLNGFLAEQDFWVSFFRDFNKLLIEKYDNVLRHIFFITAIAPTLYFMQGVYEASCLTDDKNELSRLISLVENLYENVYDWIGEEYDKVWFEGARDMSMQTLSIHETRRQTLLTNMIASVHGENVRKIKTYGLYDSFLGDYGKTLYSKLCKTIDNGANNCLLIIDIMNEFEQRYVDCCERDSEFPWYYSHALLAALIFFFGGIYRYEDELMSQVANNFSRRLLEISKREEADTYQIQNYIKALMLLYENDNDNFYKTKSELYADIKSMSDIYKNNCEYTELFLTFFSYFPE